MHGQYERKREKQQHSPFIEHMVFKGTKNRTAFQIVEEMERFGIQINAFTTKALTAYYTVSVDEYAEKCMDMLSDLYYNATFIEENMQREKGVVLEEISMSEDDSEDLCMELLCKAHFGNDPIAIPILGTAETVKSFTPATIKEFMDKYYRSDNTFIAIVGNITPKRLRFWWRNILKSTAITTCLPLSQKPKPNRKGNSSKNSRTTNNPMWA